METEKKVFVKNCIVCGDKFEAKQETAKTCSQTCKNTLVFCRRIASMVTIIPDKNPIKVSLKDGGSIAGSKPNQTNLPSKLHDKTENSTSQKRPVMHILFPSRMLSANAGQ